MTAVYSKERNKRCLNLAVGNSYTACRCLVPIYNEVYAQTPYELEARNFEKYHSLMKGSSNIKDKLFICDTRNWRCPTDTTFGLVLAGTHVWDRLGLFDAMYMLQTLAEGLTEKGWLVMAVTQCAYKSEQYTDKSKSRVIRPLEKYVKMLRCTGFTRATIVCSNLDAKLVYLMVNERHLLPRVGSTRPS